MIAKNIFKMATEFQKQLKVAASNYPDNESVYPIITEIVKSLKSSYPILKSIKSIASLIDCQNNIENNCHVYFQIIVDPKNYEQLVEEPTKTEITNILKKPIEEALTSKFKHLGFTFDVKVGIVLP